MNNTVKQLVLAFGISAQAACVTTHIHKFNAPMSVKRQTHVVDSLKKAVAPSFAIMQKAGEFPAYEALLSKNIGTTQREEAKERIQQLRYTALTQEVGRVGDKHSGVFFEVKDTYSRVPNPENPKYNHLYKHWQLTANTIINDRIIVLASKTYPGIEIKPTSVPVMK